MTEWIRQLASRVRDLFRAPDAPPEPPGSFCVRCTYQGPLRMRLIAYPKRCGHMGYAVEIDYRTHPDREVWLPIATFDEDDVTLAIELLQDAQLAIEATPAENAAPMWLTNGLR